MAKISRKQRPQKAQNQKKKLVFTVKEEPHPEGSVNFLQLVSRLYELDYSSGDDNMVATIHIDLEKIEPLNKPIKIVNVSNTQLFDSGSACSIWNRPFAAQVVNSNPFATWVREINKPQLQTFSNEPIHIEVSLTSREAVLKEVRDIIGAKKSEKDQPVHSF